ncbi:MAG: hypothetical protein ACXWW7_10130 [Nocardioides sp.]
MSIETLMDPQDFAERLERGFGFEPPHAPAEEDLGRGRRRLRRRRAGTSLAALATVGVIGAGASLVPGLLGPDSAPEVAPAAGGEITAAEIVATCLRKENVNHYADGRSLSESAALRLMGDNPELMTSAVTGNRTEATLRSEDGSYWGECQFRNAPENGVKNTMSVYPTAVSFPREVVSGVPAHEVTRVNDPRLEGTATASVPDFEIPCLNFENTKAELAAAEARCPEFTMHWNDRRPAEVAKARITTPDGVSTWADVRDGYLSFAYTGKMTPEIAAEVAHSRPPGALRVVFYDKDGDVLVDDRDPGHVPVGDDDISILNFPSLAWWLT